MSRVPNKSVDISLQDLLKFEHLVQLGALAPKRQVHSILAGRHSSKLRGRGLDFEEVRKYVAGDDVRNIDWRVTARTKVTHTKVFTEEKERPVFVVTDMTRAMFFGSKLFTKSVTASQLAAIAGFRTLKAGDRFGGLIFGDQQEKMVRPQRSRSSVLHYLNHLVDFNTALLDRKQLLSNVERLNAVLKKTHSSITHDYVVTIISDFSEADSRTRQQLINLSNHNDVILVHITDPMEMKVGASSLLLSDGDDQFLFKGGEAKFVERLAEKKLATDNFLKDLRKYSIVSLQISNDRPVVDQLKQSLGQTSVRR
jgi:uncharacterized protein (DUF58 family)